MLTFAGLPCLADREGRLEDRPRRIEAELFPFRHRNVSAILAKLHSAGFINRYVVDGKAYIQIVNFKKHQNPHVREPQSVIPAPPTTIMEQHSASTIQAQCPAQCVALLTPDSPFSDSPFLTPHSLTAGTPTPSGFAPVDTQPVVTHAITPDALALVWNEECRKPIQPCRSITPERREKARALIELNPSLDYWRNVIRRINASPFCRGETGKDFRATFDWLLDPETHVKVAEGNYDPSPQRTSPRNAKTAGNAEAFRRFVGGKEVLT